MKHVRHGASSRRAAVTVAAAFALSLVAFAAALLLPQVWEDKEPLSSDFQAGVAGGGRYRMMRLFHKSDGGMTGAVVLTTDTHHMTMTAVGYAPGTAVRERSCSLGEVYRREGTAAAGQALCQAASLECETVLSFSVSDVAAFLIYLQDRLPCTLTEPVGELPAGEVTLTPMQTTDVLRYTQWEAGARGQAYIHAEVIASLCTRYLTESRDLEADFGALTALCDQRLNISQFEAVRQELEVLAKANAGDLCAAYASDLPIYHTMSAIVGRGTHSFC